MEIPDSFVAQGTPDAVGSLVSFLNVGFTLRESLKSVRLDEGVLLRRRH